MSYSTIKIGHASGTEHNNATGGISGDQTGKEVVITEKYPLGEYCQPTVRIRPKTEELAKKLVSACIDGCNNSNIGYDQNGRNSLYTEAKKVGFDLSLVAVPCETDCSAFMSVCAVAAGSGLEYYTDSYPNNGPTTSSMKSRFSACEAFEVTEHSVAYLKNPTNLKFGDILVEPGSHTFMILEGGPSGRENSNLPVNPNSPTPEYPTTVNPAAYIYRIDIDLLEITSVRVSAESKIIILKNGTEEALKDTSWLQHYDWKYKITNLTESSDTAILGGLTVTSDSTKFSAIGLKPNTTYTLQVTATQKDGGSDKLSSRSIFFSTLQEHPESVSNLKASFDDWPVKRCYISFDTPTNWGSIGLSKGYRVSLIINGALADSSDDLIPFTDGSSINKEILLNNFLNSQKLKPNDLIQIGVQTWLKNGNKLIFDNPFPKCSKSSYVRHPLKLVDKIYTNTNNKIRRVILYNNK